MIVKHVKVLVLHVILGLFVLNVKNQIISIRQQKCVIKNVLKIVTLINLHLLVLTVINLVYNVMKKVNAKVVPKDISWKVKNA